MTCTVVTSFIQLIGGVSWWTLFLKLWFEAIGYDLLDGNDLYTGSKLNAVSLYVANICDSGHDLIRNGKRRTLVILLEAVVLQKNLICNILFSVTIC